MGRKTRLALPLIISIVFGACVVGEGNSPGSDDGGPNGQGEGQTIPLSGQTLDYFTGLPVADVPLETLGLAPERMAFSSELGGFDIEIPLASAFFMRTGATQTHRPTVSEVYGLGEESADIHVFSDADIRRQHVTTGIEVLPDTTTVVVELRSFDGSPISGFSRSDITIVDPNSEAVIAAEPFVFGALGDIDPALTESTETKTPRFAFLNVVPGDYAIVVTCPTCQPEFETSQRLISAAGVTLVRVSLGSTPGPATDSFESIFPLFARGVDGGLGCANCHTAGQTSPALDGDPALVRETLLATPGLIDLVNPDLSELLSKPLYEVPANHPNATFLSADEPSYQAIRAWIEAGAN